MKAISLYLYQFTDFPFEKFTDQYLQRILPHRELVDVKIDGTATYVEVTRRGARNPELIADKCRYLQDIIIRRANSYHNSHTFTLSAEVLRSVIGKDYKPLLEVFVEMGYIGRTNGKDGKSDGRYVIGKSAKAFELQCLSYTLTGPLINYRISGYQAKTTELLTTEKAKYIVPVLAEVAGENFYKQYLCSLSYIRISDTANLKRYISRSVKKEPDKAPYYDYITSELSKRSKDIYRVDDSHRIYHVLTGCEREIKRYLSIDFTLDCRNSHPLLFNFFIFLNKGISIPNAYKISSFLLSYSSSPKRIRKNSPVPNHIHNGGQIIRNVLSENNIANEDVAKLADDELEYIFLTSKGRLWDEFCFYAVGELRDQLKVDIFKAVFYSNSPTADKWNDKAAGFKKRFPSVYRLIGDWKRSSKQAIVKDYMSAHHLPTDKGTAALSIAMMSLESEIFIQVLRRLYAHRWHAVHIHDCIVIPKDGNVNHPTRTDVETIMKEVYQEYGLCPTFSYQAY